MKTIIFDIDGTITNIWPIEKLVLLYMTDRKFGKEIEKLRLSGISDTYKIFLKFSNKKISKKRYIDFYNQSFSILLKKYQLPALEKYPVVKWIIDNKNKYHFVYATGGQESETLYILKNLGLIKCFDLENSVNKTNCRFSKVTGIPFRKIKSKFKDCILISDSKVDGKGAILEDIPYILLQPKQNHLEFDF